MLQVTDLIRLAHLIRLGAETVRAFEGVAVNGVALNVSDASNRIEVAADELLNAADAVLKAGDDTKDKLKLNS